VVVVGGGAVCVYIGVDRLCVCVWGGGEGGEGGTGAVSFTCQTMSDDTSQEAGGRGGVCLRRWAQ